MIRTVSFSRVPPGLGLVMFGLIASGAVIVLAVGGRPAPPLAAAVDGGGLEIPYEVSTDDVAVDWTGDGGFDPRGKCPPDFFREGFVVLCRKLADGTYFRFLYHKGRRLLYRVDKVIVNGRARVGLHWVESTRFGARYRIADPAFRGGRTVAAPDGRGGARTQTFSYGEAVPKTRTRPGRELFRETHIDPDQCPEWWDVLNFLP